MKKITPFHIKSYTDSRTSNRRSGSTLSEVLISVMVLGIGVISVATLFPLSVLRALRANQFTQATVLRYNAEASIGALDLSNKYQFFGPDNRPGQSGVNDNAANGTDATGTHPGPNGIAGDGDDYSIWDNDELYSSGSDDVNRVLIDPLGYHLMGDLGGNWNRSFGNTADPNFPTRPLLRRVSGGHPGNNANSGSSFNFTRAEAQVLATLQDQFTTLFDVEVASAVGTPIDRVNLPTRVDSSTGDELAAIVQSGGVVNVTVFANGSGFVRQVLAEDLDGNGSLDPGEDVNGNGNLDETQARQIIFDPPLPASVGTGAVERVVVQSLSEDFTWMITARLESRDLEVDMDVVVFHKRRFDEDDERIFNCIVNDTDPGADNIYDEIVVVYSSGAGNRPFAKAGDWMLDVSNNYWYRVQSIRSEGQDTDGDGNLEMVIRIDRSLIDLDGNQAIQAAFMRGVVEVYPIGRQ